MNPSNYEVAILKCDFTCAHYMQLKSVKQRLARRIVLILFRV